VIRKKRNILCIEALFPWDQKGRAKKTKKTGAEVNAERKVKKEKKPGWGPWSEPKEREKRGESQGGGGQGGGGGGLCWLVTRPSLNEEKQRGKLRFPRYVKEKGDMSGA